MVANSILEIFLSFFIEKNLACTIIISDLVLNIQLEEQGFIYLTVNYSINFSDRFILATINQIENARQKLKCAHKSQ